MSAIAIIPARSGSQRIPNKNIRDFFGKPIMVRSIETAMATGLFDEIIVSTDSYEYASIAIAAGAKIRMRGKELSEVGTNEVARDALIHWQQHHDGKLPDFVCCIYPTAPLMTAEDLGRGRLHCELKHGSFAFAVGAEVLRDAGWFYWGSARNFIDRQPLIHPSSTMIPIEEERCIDINFEADWLKAERVYQSMQEQLIP